MFILAEFIKALAIVLNMFLTLYMWVIIARALISWVNPDPHNPLVQFLHKITEPVMAKVRKLIPISGGGIDFTPLIILFAIVFLQSFLVNSLHMLAMELQTN